MNEIYKWERVNVSNSRGLKLAALLHSMAPGPIVIMCHGFTGSKEGGGRAKEMAEELGRHGWASLLFDFAGNGESEGNFEDLTLSGQIDDLSSIVDWCKDKGFNKIVTLGRSFGGSTVICQAAGDSRISGICTWAAPARLMELFGGFTDESLEGPKEELVTLAGEDGMIKLKRGFFCDLKSYDVASNAALISPRPLLVIQGTKDMTVPAEDAEIIYNAADNPKKLFWIEDGDHQFSAHYKQVWGIVLEWLTDLNRAYNN